MGRLPQMCCSVLICVAVSCKHLQWLAERCSVPVLIWIGNSSQAPQIPYLQKNSHLQMRNSHLHENSTKMGTFAGETGQINQHTNC